MAPITLPMPIQTMLFQEREKKIYYPQVFGSNQPYVEQRINGKITELMGQLVQSQYQATGKLF